MGDMFGPAFLGRLQLDHRTRPFLQQQDFLQMMQILQKNPGAMQTFFGDPRFKLAMQVLSLMRFATQLHLTDRT